MDVTRLDDLGRRHKSASISPPNPVYCLTTKYRGGTHQEEEAAIIPNCNEVKGRDNLPLLQTIRSGNGSKSLP